MIEKITEQNMALGHKRRPWSDIEGGNSVEAFIGSRGGPTSRIKSVEGLMAAAVIIFHVEGDNLTTMAAKLEALPKKERGRLFRANAHRVFPDLVLRKKSQTKKQYRAAQRELCQNAVPPPRLPPQIIPKSIAPRRNPAPSSEAIREFYASWDWKSLRYEAIRKRGARCECCGSGKTATVAIHVDHIKPLRYNWDLRLDATNLQILCADCNLGKGSHDETDWRVG